MAKLPHLTDGHIFQYKDKYCYVKAAILILKKIQIKFSYLNRELV
ncbi:hypothetical protein BH695_4133 [Microcystis aeruginosa PCC 7806SL]|nr:hypothetical protein BH695_4133 [Microcystis aeruginosa PCC 7806SL]